MLIPEFRFKYLLNNDGSTNVIVTIAIYDSATNLPANGNNINVAYIQTVNGVGQDLNVVVPGLSVVVYNGLYNILDNWVIVDATSGGIPPNPAQDDLQIINVLTTPETAIGTDDGTVIINATSSFAPIQYSIDNVNWQNSNEFTGLLSGAGTAYVKDTFGIVKSLSYTISLLGNILVSSPSVDLGNGNISNWNACFNPIWFKYQRRDFEITSIIQDPVNGGLLVSVNADMSNVTSRTVITSLIPGVLPITSPGDFVYINTELYQGSYEVIAKTGGTLSLVATYTANDTTGYININSLRPQYNIQTQISYIDPITGKPNSIKSINYPFPDGSCAVDISSFLKSLLRIKDYSQYNLINYRDMQLSASYQVQYAEVWSGNTPVWANITRPFYVTYAARQLQQVGGGNLQEFVTFPNGFQPARWLTDFEMPVYSDGFPFDLSFIFSEYMVGLNAFYTIILLDINQNPLPDQSATPSYLLNEDGTYLLNQDGSKFIIAAPQVQAGLVEHVGLNRLLINFTPPSTCWYFSVQISYSPVSGTVLPITQPLICRIADQGSVSTNNPVYVRWIGLTGSWNYYKFVYNQVLTLDVTNTVTMKSFVTDWQNSDTIIDVISKDAGQNLMVFGENVTTEDIKGLQSIKYSPKVQIYSGNAISGNWWQTVIVKEGSFTERETYLNAYNLSITFALPVLNTQYQ